MIATEDYYRILQVHFLAEPEVIESAYRRLAKKYHPDVNKSAMAEAMMKKINEAYETLRDSEKRRLYDLERQKRLGFTAGFAGFKAAGAKGEAEAVECPAPAREALHAYFTCIAGRDFQGAYELISSLDKSKIPPDDFVKWQSGVGKVYELQEFRLEPTRRLFSAELGGRVFGEAVEFSVTTVEKNSIMGRLERDHIKKTVVLEGSTWGVYIGFEDIRPYIARFEELSGLLVAKSAISDMVEHYSLRDPETGLYNKKGFSEAAQREIWRYYRYGNIFSVMLIEVSLPRGPLRAASREAVRRAAEWAGRVLGENFRNLDIVGRWGEAGFIVLLPETNLGGCLDAARKVLRIFEEKPFVVGRRPARLRLDIGIEEFSGSLEETIRNLSDYVEVAGRSRRSSIVCRDGVFEE